MMAANKVAGIRCGVCSDTYSARMIRQHNDANMLALRAGGNDRGARLKARRAPRLTLVADRTCSGSTPWKKGGTEGGGSGELSGVSP